MTAWSTQYDGLDVGKTVRWGATDWTVVGRFTDRGGIAESEVWGDTPCRAAGLAARHTASSRSA